MFIIQISTPYINTWNFQDTGRLPGEPGDHLGYYQGPPIHTVTVFANPFLQDKPSLDQEEEGVHRVEPGEEAPSEGPWHTLYFLPGIHDIGPNFQVHANKTYYIPGEFWSLLLQMLLL